MCCRHLGTPVYYGHQSNGFQQAANRYFKMQTENKQKQTNKQNKKSLLNRCFVQQEKEEDFFLLQRIKNK